MAMLRGTQTHDMPHGTRTHGMPRDTQAHGIPHGTQTHVLAKNQRLFHMCTLADVYALDRDTTHTFLDPSVVNNQHALYTTLHTGPIGSSPH